MSQPFYRKALEPPLQTLTVVRVESPDASPSPSSTSTGEEYWVTPTDMQTWKQVEPLLRNVEHHCRHYNIEFTVKNIGKLLRAVWKQERPILGSSEVYQK